MEALAPIAPRKRGEGGWTADYVIRVFMVCSRGLAETVFLFLKQLVNLFHRLQNLSRVLLDGD